MVLEEAVGVERALSDLAYLLESAEQAEARLDRALAMLERIVPYDQCALLEALPEQERRLRLAPDPRPPDRATLGRTLRQRLRLVSEHGRPIAEPAEARVAPIASWRSTITVPLIGLDRVVGLLFVGREAADAYGEQDVRRLSVVAAQLATYLTALHLRASETRHAGEVDEAHDRMSFLAEAGAQLGGSLDVEATLANLARLVVPRLTDWCTMYVVEAEGRVRRLAAVHADPAKNVLLGQLVDRFPLGDDPTHPVRRAIATGETIVTPETPAADVDRYASSPQHASVLRRLGITSAVVIPLVARERILGALSLAPTAGLGARPLDLELAQVLAGRAALAVDNARLYRASQEQTAALHEAAEVRAAALGAAQAALATRDELLAMATHDLRNPLTSVKAEAQMIRRRATGARPPEPAWFAAAAARVEAAATKMDELIGELLDYARLQAGELLDLHRRPTDLVQLAREVVDEQQERTTRHRIVVRADQPELVGAWDRVRLERVLANLVSNAVKYSPEGGEVVVGVTHHGDWAVLTVRDQGIGIPPEDVPRVFERFHRAANVGHIEGTGLGLAGARQIVEQHGGTVAVESELGEGTELTVRLPLRRP
jgi:signal transduction histidine kinase